MPPIARAAPFLLPAALALFALPSPADVLVLKDGNKVEGDLTDRGDTWEVKTKYGTLTVNKSDVKKILKDPAQITAEAESIHKLAQGMYDDAMKIENDPKERNRKLTAGLELLEKSLKIYNEAREVFSGSEYDYLDKAATTIIQEMRLYRDKMSTEQVVLPPDPPKPQPKPEEQPQPPAAPPPPKPEPKAEEFAPPEPVKPASKQESPPPPPALKTPEAYVADLASTDAKLRLAAVRELGKTPAPERLAPLIDLLKSEDTQAVRAAAADAVGGYDGALLAKQPVLKDLALNGSDDQKRAVVAVFKKAATEPGIRFLVEHFVARGDVTVRNETASALKKHKKIAIKPLIEFFRKSNSRPDVQVEIIKVVGITGESKQGAAFLIALMEIKEVQNTILHALRKIDKPVIPALIQQGLPGPSRTRMWSAWLLRGLTGQSIGSSNAAEWSKWWALHRKSVEAEEAKWDKADEACDWAVDELDWSEYDVEIINSYYGTYWWWPWKYTSSRGRPRGVKGFGGMFPGSAGGTGNGGFPPPGGGNGGGGGGNNR